MYQTIHVNIIEIIDISTHVKNEDMLLSKVTDITSNDTTILTLSIACEGGKSMAHLCMA